MLMFCVVMAFALAGCGGSKEKEAAQAPAGKVLKVATDAKILSGAKQGAYRL